MEIATGMMVGMILIYIILIGLSIACFVFSIILMIKANKALSIWIRKNDDMNMQPPIPPYPPSYPTPPAKTDYNEN